MESRTDVRSVSARRRSARAVLMALTLLIGTGSGVLTLASPATAATPWHLIEGPDSSSSQPNVLNAVACTGSSRCSAVGDYYAVDALTLIATENDNGSWSMTSSPSPAPGVNVLNGISCPQLGSCVAVGYDEIGANSQTLIETQNANGTWSVTPSPNTSSTQDNVLNAVSCSLTSCVAVGYYYNGTANQTLILTQNAMGTWILTEGPDTSSSEGNVLSAVSCPGAGECVAVGKFNDAGNDQTLILIQNPKGWGLTEGPDTSASQPNELNGVSCPRPGACVAVGAFLSGIVNQTLIVTQNAGGGWGLTEGPDTSGSQDNVLSAVSCPKFGAGCVAVGNYDNGANYQTLILTQKANGRWGLTEGPDTSGSQDNFLTGVSCLLSGRCTAVGYFNNGITDQTLILTGK